jgi:hypothetical protein
VIRLRLEIILLILSITVPSFRSKTCAYALSIELLAETSKAHLGPIKPSSVRGNALPLEGLENRVFNNERSLVELQIFRWANRYFRK